MPPAHLCLRSVPSIVRSTSSSHTGCRRYSRLLGSSQGQQQQHTLQGGSSSAARLQQLRSHNRSQLSITLSMLVQMEPHPPSSSLGRGGEVMLARCECTCHPAIMGVLEMANSSSSSSLWLTRACIQGRLGWGGVQL